MTEIGKKLIEKINKDLPDIHCVGNQDGEYVHDEIIGYFRPNKSYTPYIRKDLHETALADKDKRISELEAIVEKLKDPNAVHLNMLKGGAIARLSLAQIEHLYQDEVFNIPRVDKRLKELEGALNALQPLPIMDAPLNEKCVYKFNGKIFIGTMKSDGFIQSMGWTDQHIEDEHPDDGAIPLSAIQALLEGDTKC